MSAQDGRQQASSERLARLILSLVGPFALAWALVVYVALT